MPDYAAKARALRRKAADPVTTPGERESLLAKARELEAKYPDAKGGYFSFTIQDTTITSRDGRPSGGYTPSDAFWTEYMERLVRNQWQWNSEYYNRDGSPVVPDEDAMYEEAYKYDGTDYEQEHDDG